MNHDELLFQQRISQSSDSHYKCYRHHSCITSMTPNARPLVMLEPSPVSTCSGAPALSLCHSAKSGAWTGGFCFRASARCNRTTYCTFTFQGAVAFLTVARNLSLLCHFGCYRIGKFSSSGQNTTINIMTFTTSNWCDEFRLEYYNLGRFNFK
jgi:hypothetical protein